MEQTAAAISLIDKEAQYHDGLITFPAYLYEQLKQGLGIGFEPEYLDKETDPEILDAHSNHRQDDNSFDRSKEKAGCICTIHATNIDPNCKAKTHYL